MQSPTGIYILSTGYIVLIYLYACYIFQLWVNYILWFTVPVVIYKPENSQKDEPTVLWQSISSSTDLGTHQ